MPLFNILLIQGVKGGVGTTSITANVANALKSFNQQVFVLDLCEQNLLRMHFGAEFTENNGWAINNITNKRWVDACFLSDSGIHFIPFGFDSDKDLSFSSIKLNTFKEGMSKLLIDLTEMHQAVFEPDNEPKNNQPWLLIDTNKYLPKNIQRVIADLAHLELNVIEPNASSYTCFLQQNIKGFSHDLKLRYLINQYNPSITLERDICNLLFSEFSPVMVPSVVHFDRFISEALAQKQTAHGGAPQSQAHRDFSILASWLMTLFVENVDE